jgi:hypothetical protein
MPIDALLDVDREAAAEQARRTGQEYFLGESSFFETNVKGFSCIISIHGVHYTPIAATQGTRRRATRA